MNIFYIHEKPEKAVKMMHNKHICKMILESAQMLSTAHREIDQDLCELPVYKSAYKNHPSTVWARQSRKNYDWLYKHFMALCKEYTLRYNRVHLTEQKLGVHLSNYPMLLPEGKFTQPPCAMPDIYKLSDDHIFNYRKYYLTEKIKNEQDLKRFVENMNA